MGLRSECEFELAKLNRLLNDRMVLTYSAPSGGYRVESSDGSTPFVQRRLSPVTMLVALRVANAAVQRDQQSRARNGEYK